MPFDREKHRGLGVDSRQFVFARRLNAIYVTTAEFSQAARHYPIAFARDPAAADYVPVVITSFREHDNLFVDADGRWRPGVYVPAYVRRYPFFTVPVRRNADAEEPDFLICIDEAGLSAEAPALFDARGEATAAWTTLEAFIRDGERARRNTQRFTDAIADLDIVEPFEAHGYADSGGAYRLGKLSRIDERKLKALPGSALKALVDVGALSAIYAHLASLDNFAFLLDSTSPAKFEAGA